jgi:uncharacterized RDD family membrane protein YckC
MGVENRSAAIGGAAPDPAPLFARYQRVIAAVDDVPAAFFVHRRRGRLDWISWTLRTKLFLRFFVLWHIRGRAAQLRRAYLAQAACDPDAPHAGIAKQIEAFEGSLPPVRTRPMFLAALVGVFIVAFLLARFSFGNWDPTFSHSLESNSTHVEKVGMRDTAHALSEMTGASLALSPREVGNALEAFPCVDRDDGKRSCSVKRGVVTTATSFLLLGIAIWLVALLPLTSFRLKRMLFNLDGEPDADVRAQDARGHLTRATGLYRAEADLFAALGRPTPRELPVDLLCQACVLVLPAWVAATAAIGAVWGITTDVREGYSEGDLIVIVGLFQIAIVLSMLPVARISSLRWAQRQRVADAVDDLPPPAAASRARVRRRAAAHLLDTVPLVVLGSYLARRSPFDDSEVWACVYAFGLAPLAIAFFQGTLVAGGGRTLGKAALGLRIVRSDGSEPTTRRAIVRECVMKGLVFGPPLLFAAGVGPTTDVSGAAGILVIGLFVWPLYALDYAGMLWRVRKSPIHDLLLDTTVVREAAQTAEAPAAAAVSV